MTNEIRNQLLDALGQRRKVTWQEGDEIHGCYGIIHRVAADVVIGNSYALVPVDKVLTVEEVRREEDE